MSIIGIFTKDGTGYNGALRTLSLNAKARIVANDTKTENAPDFRVFIGKTQVGAGWNKVSKQTQRAYLTISLDDPSFPQPIYANLIEGENGAYNLLWSRSEA